MIVEYIRELQYDPDDIDVRLQHFRLGHIIHMIESEKLIIYNDDSRHRTDLWTNRQKSLFIESLLIKLPIPLFYFDGSNNQWKVIDGLQRLSTVNEYIQSKFRLTSLEYLKRECKNRSFEELPGYLQARIYETEIVAYVINPGTPREVKYNIFRRINETGTHLNGQEIRHVFFHGQASDFVKEMVNLPLFRNLSKSRISPLGQMTDREYINRFVSFFYLLDNYDGDMEEFLYKGMDLLHALDNERLVYTQNAFIEGLERTARLFGEFLFRKPLLEGKWNKQWNKALYDTCIYNILKLNGQQMQTLLDHKSDFFHEFTETFAKGGRWYASITYSADSYKSVRNRFNGLKILFEKYSKL